MPATAPCQQSSLAPTALAARALAPPAPRALPPRRGGCGCEAGYYVNNEYDAPELNESPPEPPLHDRLVRTILAEKPRVTRYQIDWQMPPSLPPSLPNENVPPSLPQPAECGVSSGEMMQQVENMQPQPEPMTH